MRRPLRAHLVAAPVLRHLGPGRRPARVLGVARTAVYVDVAGLVVAVTARGVPLMPNGVAVASYGDALAAASRGAPASAEPGRVRAGGLTVSWDVAEPAEWNPAVAAVADLARVAGRGADLLGAIGVDAVADPEALAAGAGRVLASATGDGAAALGALFDALVRREPRAAAPAAAALVGRGGGLTPEGDDVLAAVGATLAAAGRAAGIDGPAARDWEAALCPPAVASGTTALSATLLRLAVRGEVVEPVQRLLDVDSAAAPRWRGALDRLLRIGHSTGPAYVLGMGAAATLLAAGDRGAALAATCDHA